MVPPGGGEADYRLDFNLPAPPRAGEFITIARKDRAPGYECFYVRSVWWDLLYPRSDLYAEAGKDTPGELKMLAVECEFARGPFMTDEHKRACDAYEAGGYKVRKFDETMY